VLNTIIRQVPVVVPPREVLLHVLFGFEALHKLDDLQVGHIDLGMLGGIVILFSVQDTLLEEILVNLNPVLLGNQHAAKLLSPLYTMDSQMLSEGAIRAIRTLRQREFPSR
jgi:hypothetical protein